MIIQVTTTSPLVSVVIPVFNRAALISRALDSVANQTFDDYEIIVVDDGSTDGTAESIQNWGADRLRLIRKSAEQRGGGGAEHRRVRGIGSLDRLPRFGRLLGTREARASTDRSRRRVREIHGLCHRLSFVGRQPKEDSAVSDVPRPISSRDSLRLLDFPRFNALGCPPSIPKRWRI